MGTANRPPMMPASWKPASRANIAPSGCRPTAWPLIRGARTLFSICWMARKNSSTHTTVGNGRNSATISAGTADRMGPNMGTSSNRPASTPSTSA